jgi:hypothetical protein
VAVTAILEARELATEFVKMNSKTSNLERKPGENKYNAFLVTYF